MIISSCIFSPERIPIIFILHSGATAFITFDNLYGTLDYDISLKLCDGTEVNSIVYSGTSLYFCGNSPSAEPEVGIIIGPVCIDESCPSPPPTYTPTPSAP